MIWTFLICCLLGYATYYLKVLSTPAWTNGTLDQMHARLLVFNHTNNEQSRLLQWGIPEAIIQLTGMEVRHAYGCQRLVFTTLALFVFNCFQYRWSRPGTALAGTVIYAVLIGFSTQRDLQESAPLLGLTFCLALWAIRERKDMAFAAILWAGALNNETMLFLPALHFLVNLGTGPEPVVLRPALRAFLLGLPALICVALVRYKTYDLPHLGGWWHLPENIRSLAPVFIFFGPFWLLSLWRVKELPGYLQRCLWSVSLFLAPNMITGIISETRLLLPLTFMVVPAALWTLFPEERRQLNARGDGRY